MILVYRLLINLVVIFSPLIITIRIFKKKEHFTRFKEKFAFFSKKRMPGNLVWFHGASVGELMSVIPLIEKLEKNKNIKQILVTTSTLSSAKIFNRFKFKKTIHQFFPVDTNYLSKKLLDYWRPNLAIFIDSEIWPNMLTNLKDKSISHIWHDRTKGNSLYFIVFIVYKSRMNIFFTLDSFNCLISITFINRADSTCITYIY